MPVPIFEMKIPMLFLLILKTMRTKPRVVFMNIIVPKGGLWNGLYLPCNGRGAMEPHLRCPAAPSEQSWLVVR